MQYIYIYRETHSSDAHFHLSPLLVLYKLMSSSIVPLPISDRIAVISQSQLTDGALLPLLRCRVYQSVYNHASRAHDGQNIFSELVFSSHDHSIMDPASASLKRIGLVQVLRVRLSQSYNQQFYI